MLELKDIHLEIKSDGRVLADGFSFTLGRGDKAVIIGEEGNGKSTLLRYLYDPRLTEGYCAGSGTVTLHGKPAYLPQLMDEGLYGVTLGEYFGDTEYYLHGDLLAFVYFYHAVYAA